jgi:3-methyladenine DNA glycosylase AlkC
VEPFKNLLGPTEVRAAAEHLARAEPSFPRARFTRLANSGLQELEFKARAEHLCAALEATLPADFERAASILEAALGPAGEGDELSALRCGPKGLAGWVIWPLGEFVARRGLAHPERSLRALHAFTQRFTAEWAIRPFLEHHPELSFATLARWTADPSAHVRRLVSEGSRPRLPWGRQLRALIADPRPTLPLLRALQDDPSPYVRRSVANHLNDIAKDHPQLVADWVAEHWPAAGDQRRALLRHAARSLIKQGHRPTLRALGLGRSFRGEVRFTVAPRRIALGEAVVFEVQLHSRAREPQPLELDLRVHHRKAGGGSSPKVFKGWRLTLAAGATAQLSKRHALRPVTTRTYHAGRHRVELLINGEAVAETHFDLRLP